MAVVVVACVARHLLSDRTCLLAKLMLALQPLCPRAGRLSSGLGLVPISDVECFSSGVLLVQREQSEGSRTQILEDLLTLKPQKTSANTLSKAMPQDLKVITSSVGIRAASEILVQS